MKILGLIPARAGSKGIPSKNTRPLAGKSLVQRAIECGRASGVLDEILLSTDDPNALEIAKSCGLEVPFPRPPELAEDTTAMIDVVLHALYQLAVLGRMYDAVLVLQPTSPLRKPKHIRRAVELLGDNDAVCSVVALPRDLCPHYVMRITPEGYLDYFLPEGRNITRRQDVPPAYRREGTIFLTTTRTLRDARSFYGDRCVPMRIAPEESLNIDTPEEWAAAEARLRK